MHVFTIFRHVSLVLAAIPTTRPLFPFPAAQVRGWKRLFARYDRDPDTLFFKLLSKPLHKVWRVITGKGAIRDAMKTSWDEQLDEERIAADRLLAENRRRLRAAQSTRDLGARREPSTRRIEGHAAREPSPQRQQTRRAADRDSTARGDRRSRSPSVASPECRGQPSFRSEGGTTNSALAGGRPRRGLHQSSFRQAAADRPPGIPLVVAGPSGEVRLEIVGAPPPPKGARARSIRRGGTMGATQATAVAGRSQVRSLSPESKRWVGERGAAPAKPAPPGRPAVERLSSTSGAAASAAQQLRRNMSANELVLRKSTTGAAGATAIGGLVEPSRVATGGETIRGAAAGGPRKPLHIPEIDAVYDATCADAHKLLTKRWVRCRRPV